MKPENIKIISIVTKDNNIYGLGEDSIIYFWNASNHTWQI